MNFYNKILIFCLLSIVVAVSADTHQFVVLTDIHIADDYVVGSEPETFCTEGKGKAGVYGYYNCDTPEKTLLSSLHFSKQIDPLDFVVWLGDSPTKYAEHPQHNQTTEHIMQNVAHVCDLLSETFPNVSIFPSLGNHDHNPDNGFGPDEHDFLQQIAKLWSRWLPEEALETVRIGGYYVLPAPHVEGLKIISLNTLYWSTTNPWMGNVTGDVTGQFMWFEKQLHIARASGEKVVVIGHVPPIFEIAFNQWRPDYYDMFTDILSTYPDVVVAGLFGHMHQDLFGVVAPVSNPNNLLTPAMVIPGVTPRASALHPTLGDLPGKNPAVRVYSYDSTGLLDYTQYYANIEKANAEQKPPEWLVDYSFKQEYGVSDFSVKTFNSLAKRLINNEEDWCKFYSHFFVRNYHASQVTVDLIRRPVACSTLYTTEPEFLACVASAMPSVKCY